VNAFDIPLEESGISPRNVAAYLASSGWQLQSADEAKEIWILREGDSLRGRLLLPTDPTYVDFEIRFREALHRLCMVYGWDIRQLATNVLDTRSSCPRRTTGLPGG
jgi:hypothetical protein